MAEWLRRQTQVLVNFVGVSSILTGCTFFFFPFFFSSYYFSSSSLLPCNRPYGPMDKAPAYGAGDSGFESRYGLFFSIYLILLLLFFLTCVDRTTWPSG